MAEKSRKLTKKLIVILLMVFILVILLLCLSRCSQEKKPEEIIENTQEKVDSKEKVAVVEKEEAPKEEIKEPEVLDITDMYFWVVFYDQNGNELQRDALLYGTVPSFYGYYPEGFERWDKEIRAIRGNTYYHAICHEVYHGSGGSGGGSNNPAPTPQPPGKNEYGFYYNGLYHNTKTYSTGDYPYVEINALFTELEVNDEKYAVVEMHLKKNKTDSPGTMDVELLDFYPYTIDTTTNTISLKISEFTNASGEIIPLPIDITPESLVLNKWPIDNANFSFGIPEIDAGGYDDSGITFIHDKAAFFINANSEHDFGSDPVFEIPSIYTSIGKKFTDPYKKIAQLKGAEKFTSLIIPSSITEIGDRAFYNLSNLQNITFKPNSNLKTINWEAFYKCSLQSITLPSSLETLGQGAFSGNGSLSSVTFSDDIKITEIPKACFNSCGSLITIEIPSSITKIGGSAFEDSGLTSITFKAPVKLKEIEESAFGNSRGTLDSLIFEIPSTVEKMGVGAFRDIPENNINIDNIKDKIWYYTNGDETTYTLDLNLNNNNDIDIFKACLRKDDTTYGFTLLGGYLTCINPN